MQENNFFKYIITITMTLLILFPMKLHAHNLTNKGIEVDLGEFNFFIDEYTQSEVTLKRISENSVNIIDKQTGMILETITSKVIPKDSPQLKMLIKPDNIETKNTSYFTIQRDKKDRLATVRLEVTVVLYKSGSFSSIQSIAGTNMYPISVSNSTLENVSTYARSVSHSGTNTVYLRKPITIQGNFYTYSH